MVSVNDYLSSYLSMTSKINNLMNQKNGTSKVISTNPDEALLSIKQQELGQLHDLTSSSKQDEVENTSDFFSFFLSYIKTSNQAADTGLKNTTSDEARLLYTFQMAQSGLNLNI